MASRTRDQRIASPGLPGRPDPPDGLRPGRRQRRGGQPGHGRRGARHHPPDRGLPSRPARRPGAAGRGVPPALRPRRPGRRAPRQALPPDRRRGGGVRARAQLRTGGRVARRRRRRVRRHRRAGQGGARPHRVRGGRGPRCGRRRRAHRARGGRVRAPRGARGERESGERRAVGCCWSTARSTGWPGSSPSWSAGSTCTCCAGWRTAPGTPPGRRCWRPAPATAACACCPPRRDPRPLRSARCPRAHWSCARAHARSHRSSQP